MSKPSDTQTGHTPYQTRTPLQGRAHLINREALQDEAQQGPGSLDPKTLEPPKAADAKRWLAKRGLALEVPAGWKYLGISQDSRSLTFVSDTHADAHAIEIHLWPMPEDLLPATYLAAQEEQLEEAMQLKRVLSFDKRTLGDVLGLVVIGWGPESHDAMAATSEEDLYLATDGTGRRALSWRAMVERGGERLLVMLAMSSPLESFPDARPVFDAILQRAHVSGG